METFIERDALGLTKSRIRRHAWGRTLVLFRNDFAEMRLLLLDRDTATSHHAHAHRTELQIPLSGIVAQVDALATRIALPGGRWAYLIPPCSFHQFATMPGESGIVISITFGRTDNDRYQSVNNNNV